MNKRIAIIASILVLGCSLRAQSTNPPALPNLNVNFLTNLPAASNFTAASFGVSAGLIDKNGQVENLLKVDYYPKANYILSLEIQNGPASSVLDSGSFWAGVRKPWTSADIYTQLGVRRTWETGATGTRPSFQGGWLLGAGWVPMDGSHLNFNCELAFLTSPVGNTWKQAPQAEIRLLANWKF